MLCFRFHVENETSISNPGTTPYFSEKFFNIIKEVKSERSEDLSTLSSASGYDILLKKYVTEEVSEDGIRVPRKTKPEKIVPSY